MAPARGRDATTWAIVCFLLGLFGIAALAIAGKTDQKKIDDAVALTTAVEAAKAQRIEGAVAVAKAVTPNVQKALAFSTLAVVANPPSVLDIASEAEEYSETARVLPAAQP
jgi:tRNA1(Val) A37 N6-methylase TrmN6